MHEICLNVTPPPQSLNTPYPKVEESQNQVHVKTNNK